jgi:hypothetical protein
MRNLTIKAVVITDGDNYFIHGSNTETSAEMFKAMSPIWKFDPSTETAHFVEIEITLPELENVQALEDASLDHKVETDRADSE